MVKIEPNAFYSRQDLIDLLDSVGIDADTFIARVRPRKLFRMAWWGEHLIEALRNTEPLTGEEKPIPRSGITKRLKPRGQGKKTQSIEESRRLIGGYFDPREIGLESVVEGRQKL